MAERYVHEEELCVLAFKRGNKHEAEQLLPLTRAAVVRTTFTLIAAVAGMVSLLHLAAHHGWLNVVVELVTTHKCDVNWKDTMKRTPLHYAAYNGHLEVVTYLIDKQGCHPMSTDINGEIPLHFACSKGHLNITRYLISELQCDPSTLNNIGSTPLHYACRKGQLHITQYLISELQCDPSPEDKYGWTLLHHACSNGHLNITRYLISELQCDPSTVNDIGRTPLHYACIMGHAHIVQYLLSTGKVNPLAEDRWGNTPVFYASGSEDSYDLLQLFQPFEQCKKDFPVHTYTKLILTGYSGVGKTTIAQLVVLLASRYSTVVPTGCVADVECLTAGIVSFHVESKLKEVSNMVVYDFAGQQEYYSSHAAVLEHILWRSAAIFVCLVDLSQSVDEIGESVYYWLSFIENACSTAEGKSYVVIVGSHADLVNSLPELEEKSSLVQKIAESRVKQLRYGGYVRMDCRRVDTNDARHFISLLSNSQQNMVASQPVISFYCHVLYAFLRTKLKKTGCTLQELASALAAENDSSLPSDSAVLSEFLTTLSEKGLVLFVKNKEHHLSSWVVVEKEALLKEVNGTLFAPKHFKEHRTIASNTGIVPITSLQKVFPQHNCEMLVGFLQSMEFCQSVDSSVLQYTNLQTTPSQITSEGLLFFPGLIQLDRPDRLIQCGTLCFGWCLGCMDLHQFFSSRFLHILLLCVAYTFPLTGRGLQRMCTVWRNGISWSDDDDITTVVELINSNRWVVVAMSCSKDRPMEHAKLRSALISLVRCLQQERCPSLNVCEFLISPTLVQQYPFNDLSDTDLFDMQYVARSILLHKPSVRSYKDSRGRLSIQSLPFEPYYLLSPSSVCQLFNSCMADQPVPAALLQEVRRHCQHPQLKPQNHKELRECVDNLSMFVGRNPLEVAELKEEEYLKSRCTPAVTGQSPTVSQLLLAVDKVADWHQLGLHLGLEMSTLEEVQQSFHVEGVPRMKCEMFQQWLKKTTPGASWEDLVTALEKMGEKRVAGEVAMSYCGRPLPTGPASPVTRTAETSGSVRHRRNISVDNEGQTVPAVTSHQSTPSHYLILGVCLLGVCLLLVLVMAAGVYLLLN